MAKVIENQDYKNRNEEKQNQINLFEGFEGSKNNTNSILSSLFPKKEKEIDIEFVDNIENFRKIYLITETMITEEKSNLFEVMFSEDMSNEEKDRITNDTLLFHNKKRLEIICQAINKTEEEVKSLKMTKDQEVALCGAIFRISIHVPSYFLLNGKSIREPLLSRGENIHPEKENRTGK